MCRIGLFRFGFVNPEKMLCGRISVFHKIYAIVAPWKL